MKKIKENTTARGEEKDKLCGLGSQVVCEITKECSYTYSFFHTTCP